MQQQTLLPQYSNTGVAEVHVVGGRFEPFFPSVLEGAASYQEWTGHILPRLNASVPTVIGSVLVSILFSITIFVTTFSTVYLQIVLFRFSAPIYTLIMLLNLVFVLLCAIGTIAFTRRQQVENLRRLQLATEELSAIFKPRGLLFYAHQFHTTGIKPTTHIEIRKAVVVGQPIPLINSELHLYGQEFEPFFPSAMEGIVSPDEFRYAVLPRLNSISTHSVVAWGIMYFLGVCACFGVCILLYANAFAPFCSMIIIMVCIGVIIVSLIRYKIMSGRLDSVVAELNGLLMPRGLMFNKRSVSLRLSVEIRRLVPINPPTAAPYVPMPQQPQMMQQQQPQQQQQQQQLFTVPAAVLPTYQQQQQQTENPNTPLLSK